MKLGFIGTGVMGGAIALHLLEAGHDLVVYNRTKSKTDTLVANGATWVETPAEVAEQADVIFSMVGYPADVDAIYFGDQGIFSTLAAGKTVVDMTTSTPTLAEKIAAKADELNAHALDAPVSGGDVGAKKATLTVMVGGDQTTYDAVKPLFELVGQKVHRFGPAGKGQHTKMANQIMIAGTMTGTVEMMVYAQHAGLNMTDVLDTLSSGGADNWSMDNYAPRILKGDYTPGFFAKHFLKDLRIALDEADKMKLDLPATKLAKQLYETMVDKKGLGDDGTQGLIKLYENL
ncbi:3-hydroxyisobutyrate dehydrogenase [Secundilactobacillus pentosiphilus]|uniref:3-hydroxyisobutyrate dehydrogenase n=1 Tax=Secundilactobacillus pentosiphilus TaxID=1714682 RepID=A0A1Z5IRV0_9LACO|nr:NAD(P)-dependent oxidoreductase [Secundilactobacillus pentosiphilus]GAX04151.1 3-hydroxyisobutyrate dehydrogenase [Secundilactobacillus pentosiphilus]GAX04832.1 3-hydroxyisobutyrate dehydrogenase [Secundilactobacillus pentosiphilus]